MKAEILPFPATKRRDHIEKIAAEVATYSPKAAEKYLFQLVNRYREKLERFAVEHDRIDREVTALKRQYENRAAFYRAVKGRGAA
jgi:hypothetical protein